MDSITKADLYRYEKLSGTKGFIKGWFIPGFRYTYLLRKVIKHKKWSLKGGWYRLIFRVFAYKEYQINPDAQIGEGFQLYHRGTVVVGPIKIGKNCCISHNVTIGRSFKGGQVGRPSIGDYVWIGTGAVIVGKIVIGSYVLIAPNSFVNFDVPDNSLVIGNPGKIIRKDNPTRNYINNVIND
ncbi:MAG TPA: serine acetyltransferase [Bacteroidales bacterium]|nr:serine acetyltransferase [Bacteroidales bacterium]HBZ20107.1 serine acetyltransferase [Bacteroidales bacterium]